MREGWEIKKLGEIYSFKNGINFDKTQKNGNGILTLDVLNMYSDGLKVDVSKLYRIDKKVKDDCILKNEDILIVRSSVKEEGVAWATYFEEGNEPITYCGFIIRGRPVEKLNSKFVIYFLRTEEVRTELIKKATKSTITNINQSNLSEIIIPIPPLPEQQRIVAILDECFAALEKAKANAEQNLKNAKELFESYLQGVFEKKGEGWEERKVKDIGLAQTGTTPKTVEKENYGEFIPFIKPADVNFSGIGDIRYDNEGLSEIGLNKGRKMESGSILMVCIGATIGKVGFTERVVSCNQQINSLSVKKEFEPKFIFYAMISTEFQDKVLIEGKGAQATLPIINKSKWENLTISFPKSKADQQTIVRQLDVLRAETQKLEAVYQQKLADLEELKKSILQKAFEGELTDKNIVS